MRPRTHAPGAKAPSSFTPNQLPNSEALLIARHTRDRGARRTTFFSMRSVVMGNLLVAYYQGFLKRQPFGCGSKLRALVKRWAAICRTGAPRDARRRRLGWPRSGRP